MNNRLQAPVLVLNANYEPLNVCTTRRALGLMSADKAALVLNGRGYIQAVSVQFPAPSVIRLDRMIRRPHPEVKLSKQEVFRRDNYVCQYCGRQASKLTLDHVIPKHLGGLHSWDNLVAACPTCNHRKGGRTLETANMRLLRSPMAPTASASYIFGHYVARYQEWAPYVEGW
ncbi:MAG: HNH endonuclease [Chloroflexi bacterium]|nr:HNH endonuclease [Chloroflexota bacterium]